MPELPEVEKIRQELEPQLKKQKVLSTLIYHNSLRWPISKDLPKKINNQTILAISRRGKYLLITTTNGTIIFHLGMSGKLRILSSVTPLTKHDHFDLFFSHDKCLRFNDPRRFGSILWAKNPKQHKLLSSLGLEPLSSDLTGKYLYNQAQQTRTKSIKNFITDSHVVTGIGNIYASEILFAANINPNRQANNITLKQYNFLVQQTKAILTLAIQKGGTTIKDYINSDGKKGQFTEFLQVYGKAGEPCPKCQNPIHKIIIGQRSTFYCAKCQH